MDAPTAVAMMRKAALSVQFLLYFCCRGTSAHRLLQVLLRSRGIELVFVYVSFCFLLSVAVFEGAYQSLNDCIILSNARLFEGERHDLFFLTLYNTYIQSRCLTFEYHAMPQSYTARSRCSLTSGPLPCVLLSLARRLCTYFTMLYFFFLIWRGIFYAATPKAV